MTAPIAIIGAGPSGLALARLLEQASIDYIVFERDDFATWSIGRGGTLDLHPGSGQLAMRESGLWDEFRSFARFDASNTLADGAGNVVFHGDAEGDDEETVRPEIDRKHLQALLLRSIPAHRVQWGARVRDVVRTADGTIVINFMDGQTASGFRLIVGADGAWSKTRGVITSARPEYFGLTYFVTTIWPSDEGYSNAVSLAGTGNYMAFDGGKNVSAQKMGDGSYSISLGLPTPENWRAENAERLQDAAAMRQWMLECFDERTEVQKDLIRQSSGEFRLWPLYALPIEALKTWKSVPGVTLIGDAAHVSTPFVGEGSNCALHDSVQLARQIVKHGLDALDQAVLDYERDMLPRGIDLITKSAVSGKYMHGPGGAKAWMDWRMNDAQEG